MLTRRSGWALGLVIGACGDGGYDLVVHVPGDPARVATVEVSVLRSCDEVATVGDEPTSALRTVVASSGGGQPIGWLAEGRYGLYGRARDDDCLLYAAGCSAVTIEDGGTGTLELTLHAVPTRGCAADEVCSAGRCSAADVGRDAGSSGGPDAGGDAGLDAGGDAAVDAGGGCVVPEASIVGSADTSDSARSVAVSGAVAVVVVETGFDVVDVADPAAPTVTWSWAADGESPHGVAFSGSNAFVSFAWDVFIYDLADPRIPERVGSFVTSWGAEGIEIRDGLAYVAGGPYVEVFDLTNMAQPSRLGSADTDGVANALAVSDVWSSMAFVAAYDAGFLVVDIQDATAPNQAGSYSTRDATDVASWGMYALMTDRTEGLLVMDPGVNPAGPPLAASLPIEGEARAVAAAGDWRADRGYAAVVDYSALRLIDLSDPEAPSEAASVAVPHANDVAVDLPHAYVAAGSEGLQVIELCLPP